MNFKYVMVACAALTMGFASCSDNDDNGIGTNEPVESEKAFAQVRLKFEEVRTRADHASFPSTSFEDTIHNAKIYVFNSNKVLQQIVPYEFQKDLDDNDQCRFETTLGLHYFLAVANAPEVVIPIGTHIDAMDQYIEDLSETRFNSYLDPDGTKKTGFFLSSGVDTKDMKYSKIEYYIKTIVAATEKDIIEDVTDNKNFIEIIIGRAMARVEAFVDLDNNDQLVHGKDVKGKVLPASITYGLANNPDAMHYFPYFGGAEKFQSPYHYLFNGTNLPDNYWPALHDTIEFKKGSASTRYRAMTHLKGGTEKYDASGNSVDYNPFYAVENSNETPTYGNATLLSISTLFIPDSITSVAAASPFAVTTVVNPDLTTVKTFYRVKNKNFSGKEKYTSMFFSTVEDATRYGKNVLTLDEADFEVIEYKDGYSYYILPLEDDLKGSPVCYDVVRNHYFEVKVKSILACGYNTPQGDEDTEKRDPLDPTAPMMHAVITVKDWVKVSQGADLQPR